MLYDTGIGIGFQIMGHGLIKQIPGLHEVYRYALIKCRIINMVYSS